MITLLPTPPSRSDPTNFAARGDEFLAALPQLVIEINTQLTAGFGNASTLLGGTWAEPGDIGTTTPGDSTFNSLVIKSFAAGTVGECLELGVIAHTAVFQAYDRTLGQYFDTGFSGNAHAFLIGVDEVGRFHSSKFFKAIGATGSYFLLAGAYHELRSSQPDQILLMSNTSATSPFGITMNYTGAAPNNIGAYFFTGQDTVGERITLRSNGGIANYSANNVNLSDENVKPVQQDIPSFFDEWMQIRWFLAKYEDQTHDDWNVSYSAQNIEEIFAEKAPWLTDVWDSPVPDVPLGLEDDEGVAARPIRESRNLKGVYDHDLRNIEGAVLAEAQRRIVKLEEIVARLEAAINAKG